MGVRFNVQQWKLVEFKFETEQCKKKVSSGNTHDFHCSRNESPFPNDDRTNMHAREEIKKTAIRKTILRRSKANRSTRRQHVQAA